MPFVPVPNCVRVVIEGRSDTTKWANTLHMLYTQGPPSVVDLTSAAGNILAKYNTQFLSLMTQEKTTESCSVTDISSDTGAMGLDQLSSPGLLGTNKLPASTALVISKQVARHYRGGHGRVYLPIGSNADLANTLTWSPAFVTNAGTAWTAFVDGIINGGAWPGAGIMVVVHRRLHGVDLTVPITDSITGFVPKAPLGTIRNRLT